MLDTEQQAAREWFESLRDRICAAFEAIEQEAWWVYPCFSGGNSCTCS